MSVHTFDSYHRSIDNHYKKKAVDIYNNGKNLTVKCHHMLIY